MASAKSGKRGSKESKSLGDMSCEPSSGLGGIEEVGLSNERQDQDVAASHDLGCVANRHPCGIFFQSHVAAIMRARSHTHPGPELRPKDFETTQMVNKGHGQIEQRTLTVSSQPQDFLDWPYLQQVFKLERKLTFLKTGQVREQVVYGFTSLYRDEIAPLV